MAETATADQSICMFLPEAPLPGVTSVDRESCSRPPLPTRRAANSESCPPGGKSGESGITLLVNPEKSVRITGTASATCMQFIAT